MIGVNDRDGNARPSSSPRSPITIDTALKADSDEVWKVSSDDDGDTDDSDLIPTPFDSWIKSYDWRNSRVFYFNEVTGEARDSIPDDDDGAAAEDKVNGWTEGADSGKQSVVEIGDDSEISDDSVSISGDDDGFDTDEITYVDSSSSCSDDHDEVLDEKRADDPGPAKLELASSLGGNQRMRVMEEIVSSERSYVASLKTINDVFAAPFQTQGMDTAVTVLFNNAVHIYTLNCGFLNELEQRLEQWRSASDVEAMSVADVFDEYIPLFWFYSRFSVNMSSATTILRSYRTLDAAHPMRKLLEECERDPACHAEPLHSFLIKPIQRIPRYILLIKEMSKASNVNNPDIARMANTVDALNKVTGSLNEYVREREGLESLIKLQKTLGKKVDLVADGRQILLDGVLSKVDRTGQPVRMHWHLFNDQIMFSRISPLVGLYKHRFLEMRTLCVEWTSGGYNYQHAFMIRSPRKSFIVFGETENMTRKWYNAINAAHQAFADDSAAGVVSTATMLSPSVNSCSVCDAAFSILSRRHHCRLCGVVACSSCCWNRVVIPDLHPTLKQRICNSCSNGYAVVVKSDDEGADTDQPGPNPADIRGSMMQSWSQSMKKIIGRRSRSSSSSTEATGGGFGKSLSLTKPTPVRTSLMSTFKSRRQVAEELLRTEVVFLSDLDVTLEVLVRPIQAHLRSSNVAGLDRELAAAFEALEMIRTISATVVSDLGAATANWTEETNLGEIFTRRATLFPLFAEYASHVGRQSRMDPEIEARVAGFEADPRCNGVRFQRRLLTPLQRLSAYTFLLTKLVAITAPDHPDHKQIVGSIEKIAAASKLVSAAMKAGGNRTKLQILETQFHGKISVDSPDRELIRTGKVSCFDVSVPFANGKVPKSEALVVHLFNDRMIISRGDEKKGFKVEHDLLADQFAMILLDADAEQVLAVAEPIETGKYSVIRVSIRETTVGLAFKEPNQKRSWYNDIDRYMRLPHTTNEWQKPF